MNEFRESMRLNSILTKMSFLQIDDRSGYGISKTII
jgi:hypothetical protein